MDRDTVTQAIVSSRIALGVSWAELAALVERPLVWTTAALLGQHPIDPDTAATLLRRLDLPEEMVPFLASVPMRGEGVAVTPTDPTIYRLHEALMVYGPALKELIHEEFGDGIMSAINFHVDLDREQREAGDRVVITMNGKFLPYDWS